MSARWSPWKYWDARHVLTNTMPSTVVKKRIGNEVVRKPSSIASVSWRAQLCESTMGCASVYAMRIFGHLRGTAVPPDSTVSSE